MLSGKSRWSSSIQTVTERDGRVNMAWGQDYMYAGACTMWMKPPLRSSWKAWTRAFPSSLVAPAIIHHHSPASGFWRGHTGEFNGDITGTTAPAPFRFFRVEIIAEFCMMQSRSHQWIPYHMGSWWILQTLPWNLSTGGFLVVWTMPMQAYPPLWASNPFFYHWSFVISPSLRAGHYFVQASKSQPRSIQLPGSLPWCWSWHHG